MPLIIPDGTTYLDVFALIL